MPATMPGVILHRRDRQFGHFGKQRHSFPSPADDVGVALQTGLFMRDFCMNGCNLRLCFILLGRSIMLITT